MKTILEKYKLNKNKIIEQLQKMPENSRVVWMVEQVEKMSEDFEKAQDKIEDNCQSLIKDFFSETIDLPAEIKRLAQIGMRYESFIDRLKSKIMLDESIVSGEAKQLLQTAKAEILQLRSNIRKAETSTSNIKRDMQIMERKLYAYREIETLKTDSKKRKARKLTEDGNLPKYKIDAIIEGIKNEK